jgi:hypothetical protein
MATTARSEVVGLIEKFVDRIISTSDVLTIDLVVIFRDLMKVISQPKGSPDQVQHRTTAELTLLRERVSHAIRDIRDRITVPSDRTQLLLNISHPKTPADKADFITLIVEIIHTKYFGANDTDVFNNLEWLSMFYDCFTPDTDIWKTLISEIMNRVLARRPVNKSRQGVLNQFNKFVDINVSNPAATAEIIAILSKLVTLISSQGTNEVKLISPKRTETELNDFKIIVSDVIVLIRRLVFDDSAIRPTFMDSEQRANGISSIAEYIYQTYFESDESGQFNNNEWISMVRMGVSQDRQDFKTLVDEILTMALARRK